MQLRYVVVLLTVTGTSLARGQARSMDPNFIPRVNVAVGYNLVRSNAPPANCNCFGLNGGFASVGFAITPWLTAAGEITGSHGSHISTLGQNLTLTTYTAGPRATLHFARVRPFAQALFGVGHGSDSYFPRGANSYSTSATSFAYTLGGGLDIRLMRKLDVRPAQVQYLHTAFPNGVDDSQNHLLYGAGVVLKF